MDPAIYQRPRWRRASPRNGESLALKRPPAARMATRFDTAGLIDAAWSFDRPADALRTVLYPG